MFLYAERQKRKWSRFRFARFLHLLPLRYRLIENGYISPSKKDSAKISKALGIDYEQYLTGVSSYPVELPEKKRNAVTAWFYRLLSAKWLRISLGALSIANLVLLVTGGIIKGYHDTHIESFYEPSYVELYHSVQRHGLPTLSILGEFGAPEIHIIEEGENQKDMYLVRASNAGNVSSGYTFVFHRWSNECRISFTFLSLLNGEEYYSAVACDYVSDLVFRGMATKGEKASVQFLTLNGDVHTIDELADKTRLNRMIELAQNILLNNDLTAKWVETINVNLDTEIVSFEKDLVEPSEVGLKGYSDATFAWTITIGVTFIFGLIFVFAFSYAMIYGEHKKERAVIDHTDYLLGFPRFNKPIKTNWRFGPFLPETLFEIIGIILVFIGGLRVILQTIMIIAPGTYSQEAWATVPTLFLGIYFLGMFLLYFIDFDLFLDDRRVYRNIILYFLVFIGLYFIEAGLMTSFQDSGSLVFNMISTVLIPNNFMSATCYFLVMFFLFFTPKFIHSKGGLIFFRCLAILPIAYTFAAFFIGHGETFFGWKMNLWVKYWFSVERLPYSILCFGYLVGLFFLRLFYKHRYGEEGAKRFFQGSKFLFVKNVMLCLIILAVWGMELHFYGNTRMNKLGIGINTGLIVLVPFLLFYHPHKGPRNLVVDYLTLGLYGLSIIWAYIAVIVIIFASGIWLSLLI